ncbi:UDP-N-acetylmuramoyl-L-alanine--D-glutamate ligase [Halobacillus shinanisalinarum]|uniref:UDP-N-acetylmuramoylalanine--D-glutamate ligase n=1 Tax=Halobacillus shinanisalinarum TaxID=2932258 RepID=A0ABY4GY97_9BACI|nr:UDP-N-acetylmuramoyl-L-alanine--D-glutamate ligase [Halobacillus shinanisalinarum]UOQ93083.1 UDP-N-acetylmuramoyl-L-alanine--D-glutamate ligase [Halobacillus shinanisalinarum]
MRTFQSFDYNNVLVLGLAKSGTAAAELLLDSGVHVRVNDYKADENSEQVRRLNAKGAEVITGGHPLHTLDDIDLIVKNPGIRYENPIVVEGQKRGISVVTEIELAGQLHKGDLIGVTGSNGKTTTTTLIHAFLEADHKPVSIAGNIGEVACEVARTTSEEETMVVELSSFQLMGVETFKPNIAVWLNLFEAHLDYHHSLENYYQAKANITKMQTEDDYLVYNADDDSIVSFLSTAAATRVPFSITEKVDGAFADEEWVYFKGEKVMKRSDIVLVGEHNLANILAAVAAVKIRGISNDAIHKVLTSFAGVPHRLEFVTRKQGILFYNDSKATNILATSYALRSFTQPTVLLAGGLDRGNDFDGLIPYLTNVKAMVVFGETQDKLADAAKQANIEHICAVETMDEAVQTAHRLTHEGEVVLLSPACASWDQYGTFEERGHMFKQAVHKLK